MSKRKNKSIKKSPPIAAEQLVDISKTSRFYTWIIFLFATLLYCNTWLHEYTQDDAIVIYDNMFTQEGVSGIPGLLGNDTFYGFFKTEGKAKLVSGGRYRPLTPIMFAIEYQIFGNNPLSGHIISTILYGLLCLLIYKCLLLMLGQRFGERQGFQLFVFLASLIYAAHPLHTEVVANIKGRDEIMSMMGAILSLYYSFKFIDTKKHIHLLWILLATFMGLMSKENTITFLAVIPLAIYYFRDNKLSKSLLPIGAALIATIVFLIIRSSILGLDFGGAPLELMNNPYLKISGNAYVPFTMGEKSATIIYTLGKYVALLFVPHPLTHDYYPRHVEMMTFGNWQVILSCLTYIGLLFLAIKGFKKKSIFSFSILYFLITLSIVSNIVFPIGTNMSERFMFMPSLGFSLGLAYLVYSYSSKKNINLMKIILGVIILLFSIKTFDRNFDWKNDFTLFTTDVKTSSNSAKVLNAAGGALVTESYKPENAGKKIQMLDEAIPYLQKALEIHPNYKNAALLLGNAHYYKKDYENSIKAYERALQIAPEYQDGIRNLAIAYRDAGQQAGEKERDLEKAKRYLLQSAQLVDTDPDTYRLLGVTHGMSGQHVDAIKYFTKVTEMQPTIATGFVNLGKAYQYYGDDENARIMFQKAINIDPKAMESN